MKPHIKGMAEHQENLSEQHLNDIMNSVNDVRQATNAISYQNKLVAQILNRHDDYVLPPMTEEESRIVQQFIRDWL